MEHGAVYLATVGGVAALLATKVVSAETVAYGDLGTEALVRMELEELPAWVALDAAGNDLYEEARTGSNGAAERPAATGEGADDQ
jgi:tartrate dehydratase beta subunit/fumarate hydratase class I family protein